MSIRNGVDQLLARFNGNPPVAASAIRQVESASGVRLPPDYVEFLHRANGGEGFVGPNAYVIFWPVEELLEMNKGYEAPRYAPGLLLFGSDGGGEAFAFDRRSDGMPVVSVPFVGMDVTLARPMGATFNDFLWGLSKA
jgi:hypothetical protein